MRKTVFLDGALGTMLQRNGMKPDDNPVTFGINNREILKSIHKAYIEAGSDIFFCNSFSINQKKLSKESISLEKAISETLKIAIEAREEALVQKNNLYNDNRKVQIAFDMTTLGELLEPMGTLTFEKAYSLYAELAILAEKHGADLFVVETMTDLYELKAAVLAIKENTSLPVFTSMTFEQNGRTFAGVNLECMVATLEGLGVDAVGINCSLGPIEIYPLAKKLSKLTNLPIMVKPNAGLPNPATGKYDIDIDEFVESVASYTRLGIAMLGGCCGTEPEHIKKLVEKTKTIEYTNGFHENSPLSPLSPRKSVVCSGTMDVEINGISVVGERLNPTGKKRLQQAILNEDWDYILRQAVEQVEAGAEILDVNIGVPGLDQEKFFPVLIKKLQSIIDIPLQIDSSNPQAIEAALRVYNGKAIVNSVTGEESNMNEILPIVKKYGAAIIGLTLDEKGIPSSADDRIKIAKRIMDKSISYGINIEDIYIDCLALTASAEQSQATETLKALSHIKNNLSLKTVLGVSNISFGLPSRSIINRTFLTMAMNSGLDLAIIDPKSEDMMSSIYAYKVLNNTDISAEKYIHKYSNTTNENSKTSNIDFSLSVAIEKGLKDSVIENVKNLLTTTNYLEIINSHLIPALNSIGKDFEDGKIYLPQLLQSASAAQGGFDVIKDHLANNDKPFISYGKIALATVKGDIHDIGKNIAKTILENFGYEIIDLGRDVPIENIINAIRKHNLKLVGLSALMTTTLESMELTIKEIKKLFPDCKVIVGGAVLTESYAYKIGADFYCKDALSSVEIAKSISL